MGAVAAVEEDNDEERVGTVGRLIRLASSDAMVCLLG